MPLPQLSLAPVLLRELTTPNPIDRKPEPLLMEEESQVVSYGDSGSADDGIMAAANLFHAARISQLIQGCRRVLDLGCGPATQLARVAALNPTVEFVGAELSQGMLDYAQRHLADKCLTNVTLKRQDICCLDGFREDEFDGVICTMTLHHLPDVAALNACLQSLNRVLRRGGAIYIADFVRLRSLKAIRFFAYNHANTLPSEVCRDYENSLRAAFSLSELRAAVGAIETPISIYSTFLMNIMVVIKTDQEAPLNASQHAQLQAMRAKLSPVFLREFNDLRLFLRLGGMRNDPF